MEYRLFLDTDSDSALAKALKERVESLKPGSASAFSHQGIMYSIGIEGVSVKLDTYAPKVPDAYKGMVKKVIAKAHVPSFPGPALGTYQRGPTTASVDSYITSNAPYHIIVVEGPDLSRVNRLFNDIRTGKADAAHRVKWGTKPNTPQQ